MDDDEFRSLDRKITKKKPKKDPYFKRPHLLESIHDDKFIHQRRIVSNIKREVESVPYKDKLKTITKSLEFVRAFTTKGVQGIVGFVKVSNDTESPPLVFKTSTDINRSVEHEFQVTESLNDMRRYCPHFVRSIGLVELPVSCDFILDSYDNSLFDESEETLPRGVMFMEYVNKLPFYRLCQDSDDRNIIISQILQVLLALEIAQTKKSLTHYDLHTSNILIQMCEKNSVFVYKINGCTYVIPTYGFFPLIIDTGISYAKVNDGKQMMSNTDNYNRGFQTTVYDKLNDVHHFLLTTFYYIETDSDGYDSLSNKIKTIFRHLPVLRKSGWKKLPNDLCDGVISKLMDDCRVYRKFDLFDEYDKASLEVLNGLIKLPFKHRGSTDFTDCFQAFMEEYHKLIDIEDFTEQDVLFVLRTIVDCINRYRDEYMNSNKKFDEIEVSQLKRDTEASKKITIDKFKNTFKQSISCILEHNVEYDINYEKLLLAGIVFSERLETNYFEMLEGNMELIKHCYEKTLVKSPIDMVSYLGRNSTPHFNFDNNTIVYYWDADEEKRSRTTCKSLSVESLSRINRSYFVERANVVLKELKMN